MNIGIIGAGPCGIICALSIKKKNPNYNITIFDKKEEIGSRIKISGNGKCNFFNENIDRSKYNTSFQIEEILQNKNEILDIFNEAGMPYFYDEEGRYYPLSESSSTIIHCLNDLLIKYHVKTVLNYQVKSIETKTNKIVINDDSSFQFDKLVVAIGGISYMNDRLNYQNIFHYLPISISKLSPSLTPISTSHFSYKMEGKRIKANVKLYCDNKLLKEEYGEILFKKDGVSGIVIFNMSCVLARLHIDNYDKYYLSIDLLPNLNEQEIKKMINIDKTLNNIFVKDIAEEIISRGDIINNIKNFKLFIRGLYEYKFSQVTSGGIEKNCLNEDLSLKQNSSIFIGGESLDVDGVCGGYNIGFCMLCGYYIGQKI